MATIESNGSEKTPNVKEDEVNLYELVTELENGDFNA
jgi:hypothetical protein